MSKADLHVKLAGGQKMVGGFSIQTYGLGTLSSGSFTVNPLNGNYQFLINGGAFTLTAPTVDCAIDLMVQNSGSAGAISFSGFNVGSTGDPLTTTNGHLFIISIRRMFNISTYVIKALQ